MVPETVLDRSRASPHQLIQDFTNLLGYSSAYMHSKVIIARLVLEFDMALAPESVDWPEECKGYDIVLRSPLYVKLWPLQKKGDRGNAT